MKIKKPTSILFALQFAFAIAHSQPANDDCVNASNLMPDSVCGYSIDYGAVVHSLSYGNIDSATWAKAKAELQLFKNMGVHYYAIHLDFDPWTNNDTNKIAIVDSAVNWIRANNGIVHIADGCAESVRNNKLTWANFKTFFKTRITTWMLRYHPDVITTVKEPGWYNGFIQPLSLINVTAADWAILGFAMDSIAKSISPASFTAYTESPYDLTKSGTLGTVHRNILSSMLNDPNLNIVGLDIYGTKCGGDSITSHLPVIIDSIQSAGKVVWIPETWATTVANMNTDSCSDLSVAEVEWAQHISDYAVLMSIPVVEWFYTIEFTDSLHQPSVTYYGIEDVMHYRIAGTTIDATQSIPAITCNGTTGNADDDVWYKFTALNAAYKLQVKSGINFNAVVDVRDGACPGTSVGCADATSSGGLETIYLTGLTIGNVYFIRVYNYGSGSGSGSFHICLSPATSTDIKSNDQQLSLISISPNPFSTASVLRFSNLSEEQMKEVVIKVVDIFGNNLRVNIERSSDSFIIKKGNLSCGIYFIKIISGNRIDTRKIIIE